VWRDGNHGGPSLGVVLYPSTATSIIWPGLALLLKAAPRRKRTMAQSRAKALYDRILAEPLKPISKEDAISIVAELAYLNDSRNNLDERAAKKRVRARIEYDSKHGKVEFLWPVRPGEFFEWATKKWPRLATVEGLPRDNTVQLSTATQQWTAHRFTVIQTPSNRAALEDAYVDCETKRQDLEVENAKLRQCIEDLKNKNKQLSDKRSDLSRRRSTFGREGGRGKAK
jgi:hypothetical protein